MKLSTIPGQILKGITDREFLAEFLSTFILLLLGDGSVAQYILINKKSTREPYLSINFGYACGVMFGAYIASGVSGAHMNPAVSIALAIVKKFKWRKVPKYIAGQMLGAFVASLLLFLVYIDRFMENGALLDNETFRGVFATYPDPDTSIGGRFLDQIVGTAILLLVVLSLVDPDNSPPPPGVTPILVGGVVFSIGLSFGTNCGYAINPARDFAPRLASLILGYDGTFSAYDGYFWIPVIGPIVGGILGAGVYVFLIEKVRKNNYQLKSDSVPELNLANVVQKDAEIVIENNAQTNEKQGVNGGSVEEPLYNNLEKS